MYLYTNICILGLGGGCNIYVYIHTHRHTWSIPALPVLAVLLEQLRQPLAFEVQGDLRAQSGTKIVARALPSSTLGPEARTTTSL